MEKIQQEAISLRKKFMSSIVSLTDSGYKIMQSKTIPLSPEETEFANAYETTFSLHALSIITSIPSLYFYSRYFKAVKANPPVPALFKAARRGLMLTAPIPVLFIAIAWGYQRTSGLVEKLKQIESFYDSNKDKDPNTITFTYTRLQSV